MTDLFLDVLNTSFAATWVVLAVVLARLLLKKAPRWMVCGLWVLVAARLLIGSGITASFSMIPSSELIPPQSLYEEAPAIHSGVTILDNAINPVYTESLRPVPGASINPLQIWTAVFANLWVLGAAVMALWAMVSCYRVRQQVRESIYDDGVYLCDRIASPFIFGLFRPKIYLPSDLSADARPHVIAHEQAHLRRKDHWWKPLGFALLTINWFNPAMWLAYALLCRDIELACDEKVIRDLSAQGKKSYSTALLYCSVNSRKITACPLAFGEVRVKQRVKSVLNYKKPAFWVILTAVVLTIALAVGLLTSPEADSTSNISTPAAPSEPDKPNETDDTGLGILLYLENITPDGATLVCTQDGTRWSDVITGSNWSLERLENNEWVSLLPEDMVWTTEAYPIPTGESRSFAINWGHMIGTLEPGQYQLGKTFSFYEQITLNQSATEPVTETRYVLFDINPLGISLRLENLTPGGATLVCKQDGTPWERIITGSDWTLEQLTADGWVSILPEDIGWDAITIGVNQDGTTEWNLDWSMVVGDLEPGGYRVGKTFTAYPRPDDGKSTTEGITQTCYAVFVNDYLDLSTLEKISFSPALSQAIQDDWSAYDAMSEFDRQASSKTPGSCAREFEEWSQVEEFVGFQITNPFEELESLEKGNWAAAPEGFNGAARFRVSWSGTREGYVQEVQVESGYRKDGMRIGLRAEIYADPTVATSYAQNGSVISQIDRGDSYEARTETLTRNGINYTIRVMGDPGTGDQLVALLEELIPHFDQLPTA